jgi:hypothetical protein
MNKEAPASTIIQASNYILSRLTTYFGSRPDHFGSFIKGNFKAHGWLPAEAYVALTSSVAQKVVKVTQVRGASQGESKFNPDLEIEVAGEFHQLAVLPALTTPDRPLNLLAEQDLSETFLWLNKLKTRAIVFLLAFPGGLEDEGWKAGLERLKELYEASAVGQFQFVIPRPPQQMIRASTALFLHTSQIPDPPVEQE